MAFSEVNELTLNLKQGHPEVIQVNMEPNTALPAEDDDSDRPKQLLVTGVCDTIGLKLDPIELFEPNLDNPAPKGR